MLYRGMNIACKGTMLVLCILLCMGVLRSAYALPCRVRQKCVAGERSVQSVWHATLSGKVLSFDSVERGIREASDPSVFESRGGYSGYAQSVKDAFHALFRIELTMQPTYAYALDAMWAHMRVIAGLNEQEKFFYLTQRAQGNEYFFSKEADLRRPDNISEEVYDRMKAIVDREGFDTEGVSFLALDNAFFFLIENIAQHEYADDRKWALLYQVYAVEGGGLL